MSLFLAAILGYFLGAIPVGLLIGRWLKGIDLRAYGSHRTGATNALRTLGARAAASVFVLDFTKGAAAVLLSRLLFGGDPLVEWAAAIAGVAAIVGHNWSALIGFTGGRGVATSAGGLAVMAPWALVVLVPIVFAVMWRTRYVSLGSIVGAVGAPIISAFLAGVGWASGQAIAYALASGVLVTVSHADNIGRLRAGTERRIGQKEQVSPGG